MAGGTQNFCADLLENMFEQCSEDSLEYQWAANILPLPCDQRYGEEEMRYMAARIREWEASAE